jgi:serine/threonine protein kinase
VKSISKLKCVENSEIEHEIEKLINLRHPCSADPIGFVLRIESGILHELKLVRLYLRGSSLSEVLSVNPAWWTSTAQAKVVGGIVLGLRFAHSLGLIHGRLTTRNILFDLDYFIQIVDFRPNLLEVSESESEEGAQLKKSSGKGLTWKTDIHAFVSILFELMVGRSAEDDTSVLANLPAFISKLFKSVVRFESRPRLRETAEKSFCGDHSNLFVNLPIVPAITSFLLSESLPIPFLFFFFPIDCSDLTFFFSDGSSSRAITSLQIQPEQFQGLSD